MIFLYGAIALILVLSVYFALPYSRLRSDFNRDTEQYRAELMMSKDFFTEKDIETLPDPVQKHFRQCGFIGKEKMSMMKAVHTDAAFVTGVDKPTLNIEYTQVNYVKEPIRFAFIDSSLYGVPFQGYDSYMEGTGSMKGVLAKQVTLFNQMGKEMDQSCLVTVLSECLVVPSLALQPFIEWESIDEMHAKATLTYYGTSVSGIFTFNDAGEMIRFTTEDRIAADFEGNVVKVPWSAVCGDYVEEDGIRKPTTFQAIWHYPQGDQIYFDCTDVKIIYL